MKAIRVIFALILTTSIIHSQPQWIQQNSNTNSLLLDLCFISENVGWVVGHGGTILKTTNGGADWIQQNSGTTDNIRSVCFVDELNGWVGSDNGAILNTMDGGATWYAAQIGTNSEPVRSIKFTNDSTGYAVISQYAPNRYGYIYKTSDAGQTWELNYYSGSDAFIDVFAYQEFSWVVGTGMEAYSSDYGNSWNYIYTPGGYWLLDVYFTDPETGWAAGGSDYNPTELIIKSSDGGYSWQVQKQDYNFKALQGIYFINTDSGWAVGDIGRILYTTDGGTTWTPQSSPVGTTLRKIQFPSENIGYTVGDGGVILKYSENPAPITVVDPNGGETITAGSDYYIEWNSTNIADVKLDYSTDDGTTWINIVDSVSSTGIYDWTVPNTFTSLGRIRISDITDSTVSDMSDDSFTIQSSHMITVTDPNGGEELQGGSTYEINWTSNDVVNVKIEYSINNGATWNSVADSVESSGVYIWNVPNVLTTQGRIKISDFSITSIYDVSDDPFRIDYVSNADDETNIIQYELLQNYPNPFNPATKIKYSVPQLSQVKLKIFDVLGNEVGTLVNEKKPAGLYELTWNAADLPSGIYFYKIQAGSFIDTKKMILLK